jgi:ribonuclease HI
MVRCTLARALRDGMRTVWPLPPETDFRYTGSNWFLLMLDGASKDMRVKLLFLFWRTWHHRNNVIHGDCKASIAASVPFLQSYVSSLHADAPEPDRKGKAAMFPSHIPGHTMATEEPSQWAAPATGWIKVNTDAGWMASDATGGIGVVVRDEKGDVLYSAWKTLACCASAEEAEVLACLEGIRYLAAHPQQRGILETDCARVVAVLSSTDEDRSAHWSLFQEARGLMNMLLEFKVGKVARVSNRVAHELAQLGKRECGVLHGAVPPCVLGPLLRDCNNNVA